MIVTPHIQSEVNTEERTDEDTHTEKEEDDQEQREELQSDPIDKKSNEKESPASK